MNKVCEILFSALRSALSGDRFDQELLGNFTEQQWNELLILSQQHNVLPLLCDGIATQRKHIPHKAFSKLVGLTVVGEDKYAERVDVIKTLAGLIWLPVNKWLYSVVVLVFLCVAYVLFKKKYYHLHEEYLKSKE